ncbi:MAG: FHA domain-containing protein [Betaproteobacteria bacterium]
MAKLVLSAGGTVVHQCFVDQLRVTIGRDSNNQIVIEDPTVSRVHAAILQVGNDHIVEDLSSAAGTFVNGERIPRRILQHGDVMDFGTHILRYLNPKAEESELDRTMLIRALPKIPDQASQPLAATVGDAQVNTARATKVHLPSGRVKALAGARSGTQIELDRVVAILGTPDEQLAVITRRPQGYFITHVEGASYPQVNGILLDKEAHPLRTGDVIEVADEKLEFWQD